MEKKEGYGKEAFVICRSRLSSSTLFHHWLISRAGRSRALGTVGHYILRNSLKRSLSVSPRINSDDPTKIDPPSVIGFETLYSHLKH
ncbi:uncharacterized protein ARMOST_02532 [Armillaria ostoyae]|uniref:Uncharacterized protein n=1 Tax=Armillaria ostoyae TaxID=47428 RepID=A0A284QS82_ARMOS|nr:uncharacterized protein ARMOST_02532 [Armillaria ostoyae]